MRLAAVLALTATLCGCASYSPPPRVGAAAPAPRPAARSTHTIVLTTEQSALVRNYYRGRGTGSTGHGRGNGRSNGGSGLPPGIAKNFARGKPLPPGIAKQTLPSDLARRLPVPPAGLDYLVVAGKLVLVEAATQVVREILLDAVFG